MSMKDDRGESISSALDKLQSGVEINEIIRDLRAAGFSVIDCIEVLCDSGRFSADEAKDVVFNSDAWVDRKGVHDSLHEELIHDMAEAADTVDKDRDG